MEERNDVNTRVTKQGIIITGRRKVSVNNYEEPTDLYDDYKGGAIIPVNNLHNEDEDFLDFEELNTPNIQKHFSLNHQYSRTERDGSHEKYKAGYVEKDVSFVKNSKHAGSYHYTFKGRKVAKKAELKADTIMSGTMKERQVRIFTHTMMNTAIN